MQAAYNFAVTTTHLQPVAEGATFSVSPKSVGGEEGSIFGGEDLSPDEDSVGWRRESRSPQAMADGAAPNPYDPHPYTARPGLCGSREPTPAAEAAVPEAKKKRKVNLTPAAKQHAPISCATLSEHNNDFQVRTHLYVFA